MGRKGYLMKLKLILVTTTYLLTDSHNEKIAFSIQGRIHKSISPPKIKNEFVFESKPNTLLNTNR